VELGEGGGDGDGDGLAVSEGEADTAVGEEVVAGLLQATATTRIAAIETM
jgi:hypothetical protein